MEAGRELDALVAKKVMGHRLLWAHRVWSMEDWLTTDRPTEQNTMAIVTGENWKPGAFYPAYLVIPHYSTDIAAAWQVVELLTRDGREPQEFYFKMTYAWGDDYGAWAYFDWKGTSDGHPLYGANAPTVSHAICLAALKAVGALE